MELYLSGLKGDIRTSPTGDPDLIALDVFSESHADFSEGVKVYTDLTRQEALTLANALLEWVNG